MDQQSTQSMTPARGRSPSAGHHQQQQQPHIRNSPSPSPHPYQSPDASIGLGIGIEPGSTNTQFGTDEFNNFDGGDNQFLNSSQPPGFPHQAGTDTIPFDPNQDFTQSQSNFSQSLLTSDFNPSGDFSLFPPTRQADQYSTAQFFGDIPQTDPSVANPNELTNMTSSQSHQSPTPPHLLKPSPGSAHPSPSFNQQQFSSPPNHHSRHTSLGPEAALLPGQVDWTQAQFQGHRRTPSDYSDVSSNAASPSLTGHDGFDHPEHGHSPMQRPQDSFFDGVMGLNNFSISDHNRSRSPSHSPHISPRLLPQMSESSQRNSIGQVPQAFMLGPGYQAGPSVAYPMQPEEFPALTQEGSMEQQIHPGLAPPSINIDFAPNAKQNTFESPKPPMDESSLTPPERGNDRK